MKRLNEYLKEQRIKNHVRQKDIALAMGWANGQYVSNIERGLATVPLDALALWVYMVKGSKATVLDIMVNEYTEKVRMYLV